MGVGSTRSYSEDVAHLPAISDPDLHKSFKTMMASGWSDLPNSLISEVKSALSKNTDDKAGKEVVANVFRAAEKVTRESGRRLGRREHVGCREGDSRIRETTRAPRTFRGIGQI